jgi:tRNA A37 threonylcarbamoyladenosine modification protein TsaB
LAQQLDIPLFGVSSLAAIAQHPPQAPLETGDQPPHLAVAMRAQRGEVFGAIYQRGKPSITTVLEEALYTQADWEAKLADWSTPYHLIPAEGGIADSVSGVLGLAHLQFEEGDRPNWATVLPFYGQHPVHQKN